MPQPQFAHVSHFPLFPMQLRIAMHHRMLQIRTCDLLVNSTSRRLVPTTHISEDGFRVGKWQQVQRHAYRHKDLSAEHVAKLEKAGIVWEPFQEAWLEGFARLQEIPKNKDGQREVASSHVTPDGFKLGTWLENQRQAHKRGMLKPHRVEALEAAGMSERKGGHEEDLDEVLEHQKLDAFLRKAYAHSDKYMRAMNSMCGYTNLPHAHTPGPTPRATPPGNTPLPSLRKRPRPTWRRPCRVVSPITSRRLA